MNFVITEWEDNFGTGLRTRAITEYDAIRRISLTDIMYGNYAIHRVSIDDNNKVVFSETKVFATWHNPNNPLYIKVCDKDGEILFEGYGTDH